MKVNDFVDYRLRRFIDDEVLLDEKEEVVQVTLRLPLRIRNKADVVSQFINVTRNSLFVAILDDGVQSAFDRLKDNPVSFNMVVNGMTPDQAHDALVSGNSIHVGFSKTEIDETDVTQLVDSAKGV